MERCCWEVGVQRVLQGATGLGMQLQASAVPQERMSTPRRPCGRRPWGPRSKAGFISIEALNPSQLFFSFRSSSNRCYQFGYKSMDFSSVSSALIHLMKDNVYREEKTKTRKGANIKGWISCQKNDRSSEGWQDNYHPDLLAIRSGRGIQTSAWMAREVKQQKHPSKEPKRKE